LNTFDLNSKVFFMKITLSFSTTQATDVGFRECHIIPDNNMVGPTLSTTQVVDTFIYPKN